ncbi:MAG: TraR/DksA C4-type zinc finger protein [Candidatus Pacebacteria bacterium]|nr:TraR/DksA C4-type zinc finger protein [Candidatus Paceibacterota bacterium]
MIDTKKYKEKLEKELSLVESEMKEIARKNPSNPKDWEAVETDMDSAGADANEVADEMESFEENQGIVRELEPQYNDIKIALKKIEDGTYGICEVGGEEIPEDRLDANPSARTCIEHAK